MHLAHSQAFSGVQWTCVDITIGRYPAIGEHGKALANGPKLCHTYTCIPTIAIESVALCLPLTAVLGLKVHGRKW